MYGITLSAKMLNRCSAPPENMLNMPSSVPCCVEKNAANARGIDAGHRNEGAHPVHDQRTQQEPQPLAHFGEAGHVS